MTEAGDEVYFIARTLLFGQTSAVYNFNRMSKLIDMMAAKLAMLLTTCYYDDSPSIERASLASSAEETFKKMLKILGITASEEEDKYKPFASIFEPLGVRVDLSGSAEGRVVVEPKPSRVKDITAVVEDIVKRGSMRGSEAASIAQKVRFLREVHFGRCGARPLRELAIHSSAGRNMPISIPLKQSLEWLLKYLARARPRELRTNLSTRPAIIFTDGASENKVTVGGVLFMDTRPPEFFSEVVPQGVVDRWREQGGHQVIGQAELLPVLVAAAIWKEELTNL